MSTVDVQALALTRSRRYGATMREESVEDHLKTTVKAAGGMCIKLNPLGFVGIPDRLVLLPGGLVFFIELKRPKGGVYSPKQNWYHKWLTERGFNSLRLKTRGEVDGFIREYAAAR